MLPEFDIATAIIRFQYNISSLMLVRKTDAEMVLHLQDVDRMRMRALTKVDRDLCNNIVATPECSFLLANK